MLSQDISLDFLNFSSLLFFDDHKSAACFIPNDGGSIILILKFEYLRMYTLSKWAIDLSDSVLFRKG